MKKLTAIFLCVVIVFAFCSCGDSGKTVITLNKVKSPVELLTDTQKGFLEDMVENWEIHCSEQNLSKPLGVTLSWETKGAEQSKYTVFVSETPDFANARTFVTNEKSVTVDSLKVGTKYYWYVAYPENNELVASSISEFTTKEGSVRFMNCDGVDNMRDLGAWTTEDGKIVNQGQIYRCGRLNEDGYDTAKITKEGLDLMKDLGIRSEVDLRQKEEAHRIASLIPGANYFNIPIAGEYTDKNYLNTNAKQLTEIFNVLGDEKNYPLIIHCSIGADRTGFVCYVLGALLGISNENLTKDYLLTNLTFYTNPPKRTIENVTADYGGGLAKQKGDTLAQKTENYLLSIGVTAEQINTFKSKMIG